MTEPIPITSVFNSRFLDPRQGEPPQWGRGVNP